MSSVEALFLDGRPARLFCVAYAAGNSRTDRRAVLLLPPFGEEMNKCRRMMALAARALQAHGSDVLVLDLSGTGDSEGDFSDGRLETWLGDLLRGAQWLRDRGSITLDLLAIRGGALLVADGLLPEGMRAGRLALWQPVTSGKQLVSQFLRLRAAEGIVAGTKTQPGPDPRALLRQKGRLEVAGYEATDELISAMETRDLGAIHGSGWHSVLWCEVGAVTDESLSPASQRSVATLRQRGMQVDAELFHGEPFWGTPEVAIVTPLVERTAAFLAPQA